MAYYERGWLLERNRRGMGLGDAYARTDESDYRPKTAPGIPISRAYTGGAPAVGSSPPKIIKDMFARALSEERGIMRGPEDNAGRRGSGSGSGSESSGPRDASPSPAIPRDRRQWGVEGYKKENIAPIDNMMKNPPADQIVPKKPLTYEERRARLRRMALDPRPVLKPYTKPTSIFQRYRKGVVEPAVPLPSIECDYPQQTFTQHQDLSPTSSADLEFTESIQMSDSPMLRVGSTNDPQQVEELEMVEEPKTVEEPKEVEEKEDSREILRRLSRVLSQSPAPPRTIEVAAERNTHPEDEEIKKSDIESDIKKRQSTSDADPEERIVAEAKLFELQDNKSNAPSDDEHLEETPRPKVDPLSSTTPKVTGAYVETPAPSTQSPRKQLLITSPQRDLPLINTASLTTAAEDLRRLQLETGIEDSTVDEFDTVLETSVIATSNPKNDFLPHDPILSNIYDEKELAISVAERERRLERLVLARMEQRLRNTSTSIRDARQGIERLEHEVSSAPRGPVGSSDDGSGYIRVEIKLPLPRLIIHNPEPARRGRNDTFWNRNWKFTWLGFILFLFGAWYLAESTMCGIYCKPQNSSRGNWKPSDPMFPWAIPTKLDQWTGQVGSGIIHDLQDSVGQWDRPRRPTVRPPNKAGRIDDDEVWIE
ncbi:hypothetical protein EG329_001041 [Mollisiaceae sp. DMI_Dod_QoI]|nr:hypothetical protein EG329_001041 [Helotiales sp. DMI_Dod_QoI]